MRDGISSGRLGLPAVALITEDFWPQGDFVARSLGMSAVPRVCLPHPIAGTGPANIEAVAASCVEQVIDALEGVRS